MGPPSHWTASTKSIPTDMPHSITEALTSIQDPGFPGRSIGEIMRFSQQDKFFHLAALKLSRSQQLRDHFSGRRPKQIFLGPDLKGFNFRLAGCEVTLLSDDFFIAPEKAIREQRQAQLEDSIVVVNNNDVSRAGGGPLYGDFYSRCIKTIFAVWDWDNHHWLDNSTFTATHADIYAPAHHENLYLLSRYNWSTVGPVYCATIQWSRSFLAERVATMVNTQRSDAPLGKHVAYAPFAFRNRVVQTLNQHFTTIGFSDHTFHTRTLEDRLLEWCGHKAHWIIPVLNDVPIRIFDALITGGIPIVPASMQHLPPINKISLEHILFYSPADITNPAEIVARAIDMFDQGGVDKLVERHRYALEHHHASSRIQDILKYVVEAFGPVLPLR